MRSISFVTSIILISILLAGCGSPVEEQAPTAVPTYTPVPTQPPPPTDTPTPIPEPTSTPMAITTFDGIVGKWTRIAGGWTTAGPDVEWRLRIDENGEASVWAEDGGTARFSLRFEDGLLYHTILSEWGCKDLTGIYEVTGVPGEYLSFKVVDDGCAHSRHFRGMWKAATAQ